MAVAVILAAGAGTRMGGSMPKQFWPVEGKTILQHTAEAFTSHPGIFEVALVVPQANLAWVKRLFAHEPKVKKILPGGANRSQSSYNAVKAYADSPEAWLIFHDAARPLVSPQIISGAIDAAASYKAATAAIVSSDTILFSDLDGKTVEAIPDRNLMWRCQTPQAFKQEIIARAYELSFQDKDFVATDDCGVIKAFLPEVAIGIFSGSEENIKITFARDMEFAAEQLKKL
ncbi:MAG: 2-C-methyl-D-erythritol 4-phosphate cytidylyltransferase [Firmicutes bacterium]|jgi:2-C-methyl-D-erythritol 4-phosphate cytidylyltransferase|nr:2-C-methyl-D-erythritol 4-phosphate cytidylyltransferase [Bacillota bacterium]